MVLKIFTKRKPGGQLLKTGKRWTNLLIESGRVTSTIEDNTAIVTTGEEENEFEHKVDLNTHGYEILNDAGAMVEKYVTPIKAEDL